MLNRRHFLMSSGAAVLAGSAFAPRARAADATKLKLAIIGFGGQGRYTLDNIAGEEIVAMCDLDEKRNDVIQARKDFPKPKFYTDYRKMLDEVGKSLDAVAVCTPDHNHAHAALSALALGKHVYCEKPLCRTVDEVRRVEALAKSKKAITQMGTQIHSGGNYRRVVELIKAGAIGKVSKVSVWCSRRPDGGRTFDPKTKVAFDLNLWRGPTADDFFYANHVGWPHFHWRWWWPYGGGVLADMGCHFMDLAFWALDLAHPSKVKASGEAIPNADNTVPQLAHVEYAFPATKARGEIQLTWTHGTNGPGLDGKVKYKGFNDGVCFEGEDGKKLVADYDKYQLLPDEFAKDGPKPDKSIAESIGHHKEWLQAIRGEGKPLCHFGYSGPLTQAVLLGNVSYRAGGAELKWDADKGTTDSKDANAFLSAEPRKGWDYPS